MLLFLVTPCLVVAVQPCMELIPILKKCVCCIQLFSRGIRFPWDFSCRHLLFCKTFISTPLISYGLCLCDKILGIKIAIFPRLRYEVVIHILFSKGLNVISKYSLITAALANKEILEKALIWFLTALLKIIWNYSF